MDTDTAIRNKLILELKKIEIDDKTKCSNFYFNSNAETFINESDIDDVFKSIYSTVISNIQKSLQKGLNWVIDSFIDHNINILNGNPLAGSTYINLSQELNHPKKSLGNIQNIDNNECFK